jgi:predicted MFS family arabinose efflux permease
MMASAIALMLALTWGGTRFAWGSPMIVGLIALSLVLSALFFWWLTQAPEPFLPIPVLANPVMRMGTAATSFAMSASIGLTIFVPLYFELVHKLSASDSGLALIPLAALTTPGSVVAGQVMMRRRRYKWVPIAMLLAAIAALALLIWRPALPLAVVMVLLGMTSIAIGSVYPVATVSIHEPSRGALVAAHASLRFRTCWRMPNDRRRSHSALGCVDICADRNNADFWSRQRPGVVVSASSSLPPPSPPPSPPR